MRIGMPVPARPSETTGMRHDCLLGYIPRNNKSRMGYISALPVSSLHFSYASAITELPVKQSFQTNDLLFQSDFTLLL